MSELSTFHHEQLDLRAGVDENGEAWFAAGDAAQLLGYREAHDMTRSLDADEKGPRVVRTPGGAQQITVITEAGLYRAIMQRQTGRLDESQTVAIKRFQRWVTHEVLPQIRRTGSYGTAPPPSQVSRADLARMVLDSEAELETQRAEVQRLEPIAAHAEAFRSASGLRTVGDVANDFKTHVATHFPGVKVRHQEVWEHAGRLGIVIRGDTVRHNQPTARAIDAGWAKPNRVTYGTHTRGDTTRVYARLTPRGEARLWDGMCAWLGEHGTLAINAAALA